MIEVLVDRVITVDGEPAELDRSASYLKDEVVQEFGDRRWTVEADDLKQF